MFQFYLSSIKRHVPTLGRLGKINEAVQPLGAFAQYLNRDAVALAYADRLTGQPFRFRQQRVGRERVAVHAIGSDGNDDLIQVGVERRRIGGTLGITLIAPTIRF